MAVRSLARLPLRPTTPHAPRTTRLPPRFAIHYPLTFTAPFSDNAGMPGTKTKRRDSEHQKQQHEERNANSTDGLSEWKKRAPYRVHEKDEHFKAIYEASCHCERVKYQLSREEPLDSKLCHCTTCQTQHAAPFQWAAIFHKEDINFSHGHHDLEWYDPTSKSAEHQLPCKVRCSFCHSPIMDEGRNMILLFPTLIKFKSKKEQEKFRPKMHMFYGQRVIDIPDGLPKWSGLNKESELIEDSPQEMVEEQKKEEKAGGKNKKRENGDEDKGEKKKSKK